MWRHFTFYLSREMPSNDIPSNTTSDNTSRIPVTLKRYQMVALDLDRTLLATNGKLADVQADYLRALSEKGFLVCIATGRSAAGTYAYAAKLRIPRLPIVCSNGSSGLVWSPGKSDDDPVIEEQFQFTVP